MRRPSFLKKAFSSFLVLAFALTNAAPSFEVPTTPITPTILREDSNVALKKSRNDQTTIHQIESELGILLTPHAVDFKPSQLSGLSGVRSESRIVDTGTEELLLSIEGGIATYTLNNPEKYNAVTLEMVQGVMRTLPDLGENPDVHIVIFKGQEHEKKHALSSGADVKWLLNEVEQGRPEAAGNFFKLEYEMDLAIRHFARDYGKQILTMVDGVDMGSGMGISLASNFIVGTSRSTFAMPETIIGFFPDVGASRLLLEKLGENNPDRGRPLAMYYGLTGLSMDVDEAFAFGLVDVRVDSVNDFEQLEARFKQEISRGNALDEEHVRKVLMERSSKKSVPATVEQKRAHIKQFFDFEDLDAIDQALSKAVNEASESGLALTDAEWFAEETMAVLHKRSPLSLYVTAELFRVNKNRDMREVFETELAMATWMMQQPDYQEGVDAQLRSSPRREAQFLSLQNPGHWMTEADRELKSALGVQSEKTGTRLQDKNVLVSGASGEMGNKLVGSLLGQGARVILTGRTMSTLQKVIDDHVKLGFDRDRMTAISIDITVPEQIQEGAKQVQAFLGDELLDGILSVAGTTGPKDMLLDASTDRRSDETLQKAVSNLYAGDFMLAKELLPIMPDDGFIINVSTIFSRTGDYTGRTGYVVPKSALNALSQAMARELGASRNMRVYTVFPGGLLGPRILGAWRQMDQLRGGHFGYTQASMNNRMRIKGTYPAFEDVNEAIVFAATEEASGMANFNLEVTNGMDVRDESQTTLFQSLDTSGVNHEGEVVVVSGGGNIDDFVDVLTRFQATKPERLIAMVPSESIAKQVREALDSSEGIIFVEADTSHAESVEERLTFIQKQYKRIDVAVSMPQYLLDTSRDVMEMTSQQMLDFGQEFIASQAVFAKFVLNVMNQTDGDLKQTPRMVFIPPALNHELANVVRAANEALIQSIRDEEGVYVGNKRKQYAVYPYQLIAGTDSQDIEVVHNHLMAVTATAKDGHPPLFNEINLYGPSTRDQFRTILLQNLKRISAGAGRSEARAIAQASARLEGKRALITGAAGEIGSEITRRYLDEGAKVILLGRNQNNYLDQLRDELAVSGYSESDIELIEADLSKPGDVEATVQTIAESGGIDILVNNAATAGPVEKVTALSFGEIEGENVPQALDNIFTGTLSLTHQLAPHISEGGSIVNISTIFSKLGYHSRTAYVYAKAALNGWSEELAWELGREQGIRVNSILPGPVDTDRIRTVFEAMDERAGLQPGTTQERYLGLMTTDARFLDRGEIANAAVFLGSDEAAAVAGQSYDVTNGMMVPNESSLTLPETTTSASLRVADLDAGFEAQESEIEKPLEGHAVLLVAENEKAPLIEELKAKLPQDGAEAIVVSADQFATDEGLEDFLRDRAQETEIKTLTSAIYVPDTDRLPTNPLGQLSTEELLEFRSQFLLKPLIFAKRLTQYFHSQEDTIESPKLLFVSPDVDSPYGVIVKRAIEELIRNILHEQEVALEAGSPEQTPVESYQLVRSSEDVIANTSNWIGYLLQDGISKPPAINLYQREAAATKHRPRGDEVPNINPGYSMEEYGKELADRNLAIEKNSMKDKVALITGGSRGVGKATALILAKAGAKVALLARSNDDLEKNKAELIGEGIDEKNILLYPGSIDREEDLTNFVDSAVERWGRIDILINNAGATGPTAPIVRVPPGREPKLADLGFPEEYPGHDGVDLKDVEGALDGNITAALILMKSAIPHMRKGSVIANISTFFSERNYRLRAPYSEGKQAMNALNEIMRFYLAEKGIRLFSVLPSSIEGTRLQAVDMMWPGLFDARAEVERQIGVPRIGDQIDTHTRRMFPFQDEDEVGQFPREIEVAHHLFSSLTDSTLHAMKTWPTGGFDMPDDPSIHQTLSLNDVPEEKMKAMNGKVVVAIADTPHDALLDAVGEYVKAGATVVFQTRSATSRDYVFDAVQNALGDKFANEESGDANQKILTWKKGSVKGRLVIEAKGPLEKQPDEKRIGEKRFREIVETYKQIDVVISAPLKQISEKPVYEMNQAELRQFFQDQRILHYIVAREGIDAMLRTSGSGQFLLLGPSTSPQSTSIQRHNAFLVNEMSRQFTRALAQELFTRQAPIRVNQMNLSAFKKRREPQGNPDFYPDWRQLVASNILLQTVIGMDAEKTATAKFRNNLLTGRIVHAVQRSEVRYGYIPPMRIESPEMQLEMEQQFLKNPNEMWGKLGSRMVKWYDEESGAWISYDDDAGTWVGYHASTGKKVTVDKPEDFAPWKHTFSWYDRKKDKWLAHNPRTGQIEEFDRDPSDLPLFKYFDGGKTNISYNSLDVHVLAGDGNKVIDTVELEPTNVEKQPTHVQDYTYREILEEVAKFTYILRDVLGLKAGDSIALNIPNGIEWKIVALAAARLGITYTPPFALRGADEVRDQMKDIEARTLITVDGYFHAGQLAHHKKEKVDAALEGYEDYHHVQDIRNALLDAVQDVSISAELLATIVNVYDTARDDDGFGGKELITAHETVLRTFLQNQFETKTSRTSADARLQEPYIDRVMELLQERSQQTSVQNVIVFDRESTRTTKEGMQMTKGRDHWAQDLMAQAEEALVEATNDLLKRKLDSGTLESLDDQEFMRVISHFAPAVPVDSEQPLFAIYTSGSTGKPKGALHTTAGYMVGLKYAMGLVQDFDEDSKFMVYADPGWITGQSAGLYAPFLSGLPSVTFQGALNKPDGNRLVDILERHNVTHFKAGAPILRGLRAAGSEVLAKRKLRVAQCINCAEPGDKETQAFINTFFGDDSYNNNLWRTEDGFQTFGTTRRGVPQASDASAYRLPYTFLEVIVQLRDEKGEETGDYRLGIAGRGKNASYDRGEASQILDNILRSHAGTLAAREAVLRQFEADIDEEFTWGEIKQWLKEQLQENKVSASLHSEILMQFKENLEEGELGLLVAKTTPYQIRTLVRDQERYLKTYWSLDEDEVSNIQGWKPEEVLYGSMYADLHTVGDAGRKVFHDGLTHFVVPGRADDVINVSGNRIGTRDIESGLVAFGAREVVAEAAATGIPHAVTRETPIAFVKLQPGVEPNDALEQQLRQYLEKTRSPHYRPSEIFFVENIPLTLSGKNMRRFLKYVGSKKRRELREIVEKLDAGGEELANRIQNKDQAAIDEVFPGVGNITSLANPESIIEIVRAVATKREIGKPAYQSPRATDEDGIAGLDNFRPDPLLEKQLIEEGRLLPRDVQFIPGVTPLPEFMYAYSLIKGATGKPWHGSPKDVIHEIVVRVPEPNENGYLAIPLFLGGTYNVVWAATGIPVSIFGVHNSDYHIPGSGAVGLVVQVGDSAAKDGRIKVGDIVFSFPFETNPHNPASGANLSFSEPSISGFENGDGMAAQFYRGQALYAYKLPDNLPDGLRFADLATISLDIPTSWKAIVDEAQIRHGDTLFMEGAAGGTGIPGVIIANSFGAQVTGLVSTDEKVRFIKDYGAVAGINRKNAEFQGIWTGVPADPAEWEAWQAAGEPFVNAYKEANDGRLADAVISHVGRSTFGRDVQILAEGGRLAFFGASSGYELSFLGKETQKSPGEMLDQARVEPSEGVLIYYGNEADTEKDGVTDPVGVEAIEAALARGARVAVIAQTNDQEEFLQRQFPDQLRSGLFKGIVSIERLELNPNFEWREMPDADNDVAEYQDWEEHTFKPIGEEVGRLLRTPMNPRGNPHVIFERASHNMLGLSGRMAMPYYGRVIFSESTANRRYSFYAPNVWMHQKKIHFPWGSILGTHMADANQTNKVVQRALRMELPLAPPTIEPFNRFADGMQDVYENKHVGSVVFTRPGLDGETSSKSAIMRSLGVEYPDEFADQNHVKVKYFTVVEGKKAAEITLTNPPVNALNREMLEELYITLKRLQEIDDVKAILITGAGSTSFVAGQDIAQLYRMGDVTDAMDQAKRAQEALAMIENSEKPVVVASSGYTLGGGNELFMAGHIRLASKSATFQQPEIRLGLIPGYGGTQRLARLIDTKRRADNPSRDIEDSIIAVTQAAEIITSGNWVTADEAFSLGIVSELISDPISRGYELIREFITTGEGELADAQEARRTQSKNWTKPEGSVPGLTSAKIKQHPDIARILRQGEEVGDRRSAMEWAIDVIVDGFRKGTDIGYPAEAEAFGQLVMSPSGKQHLADFLAKRSEDLPAKRVDYEKRSEVRRQSLLQTEVGSGIPTVLPVTQADLDRTREIASEINTILTSPGALEQVTGVLAPAQPTSLDKVTGYAYDRRFFDHGFVSVIAAQAKLLGIPSAIVVATESELLQVQEINKALGTITLDGKTYDPILVAETPEIAAALLKREVKAQATVYVTPEITATRLAEDHFSHVVHFTQTQMAEMKSSVEGLLELVTESRRIAQTIAQMA